jgi:hypothetical protein
MTLNLHIPKDYGGIKNFYYIFKYIRKKKRHQAKLWCIYKLHKDVKVMRIAHKKKGRYEITKIEFFLG